MIVDKITDLNFGLWSQSRQVIQSWFTMSLGPLGDYCVKPWSVTNRYSVSTGGSEGWRSYVPRTDMELKPQLVYRTKFVILYSSH